MKVCIAQINTTPGDFDGNLKRILKGIDSASAGGASILVFPELTIPGYLSQDLIYNTDYVDRNLAVLQQVVHASAACDAGLHIVLGYIGRNEGPGKPFTNMAAVVCGGRLVMTYQKQLLPFYDVFDELRYFEPGQENVIFEVAGRRIGIAICEDLWNDKGTDNYHYEANPLARYREAGVDLLLSLNSSPFVHGKCGQRLQQIQPCADAGLTIIYVNQVGGQDELVFDGQSFMVADRQLRYLSQTLFEDSFDIVDLDAAASADAAVVEEAVALEDLLVLGLRDYVQKSGFDELVLASSGGVDSAVVCKLACRAVGAEHVHAIRMPSIFSSDHAREDAEQLHANLGCWDYEIPIEHEALVDQLNAHFNVYESDENLVARKSAGAGYSHLADENIQARLRDVYLMHFSNAYGAMPLSTGNKTEGGCGYYTHFDMNFSYAPIKDLYKFQVVDIAAADALVPANIWQKPPSAELSPGQTDEESLLPYAVLDPIVMAYVEDYVSSFTRFRDWVEGKSDARKISSDLARLQAWLADEDAEADYQRIVSLIGRMEYKRRQTCPGTKVSKVAFGIGRRIPIVEHWN